MKWRTFFVFASLAIMAGCNHSQTPVAETKTPGQSGVASWYGVPFSGRPTASGEIFDKNIMTAAHRTLPFGTVLRVHNQLNQKTVEVKVNDRGPFVKNRIIDLSQASARSIDMPGTANVELEILKMPAHRDADNFAVQVAMLQDREEAARLRQSMEEKYGSATLSLRDGAPPMWRVLAGMEPTEAGASALAAKIAAANPDVFIVRIDPQ